MTLPPCAPVVVAFNNEGIEDEEDNEGIFLEDNEGIEDEDFSRSSWAAEEDDEGEGEEEEDEDEEEREGARPPSAESVCCHTPASGNTCAHSPAAMCLAKSSNSFWFIPPPRHIGRDCPAPMNAFTRPGSLSL